MKIAEQIKTSLDTVSAWDANWETAFFGVAFNRSDKSVFDTVAEKYEGTSDWLSVARVKRRAELCDYTSQALDDATRKMLTNVEMFSTAKIPKNMPSDIDFPFYPAFYVMLNGYRWARELNHETEKWDASLAYQKLLNFRLAQPMKRAPFYKCNFDTNQAERQYDGTYFEDASLAGCFLKLAEEGVVPLSALTREWYSFNRFWDLDHFTYSISNPNWEKSAGSAFQIMTKLCSFVLLLNQDRIMFDIIFRYLKDGWSSPQWGGSKVVVRHNPQDLKQDLSATLDSWATLHMYYTRFPNGAKIMMRNMLLGEGMTKASDGLLTSELFDPATNRFRGSSGEPTSDSATCLGCAALFLTAISPHTGSLAIPIISEGVDIYEHNFFNSHHFNFNYESRMIKIPVYGGDLTFTFGDKTVSQSFPYDGVYVVKFNEDWNSIRAIDIVGDLDQLYLRTPRKPTPTETLLNTFNVMLASALISKLSKTVIRKIKGGSG